MAQIVEKINNLKRLMQKKTTTIAQVDEAKIGINKLEKVYQQS